MPRTGARPMIGESPTTGAGVSRSASRMPGTARIVPMLTTGLLGASSTTSASAIDSGTPGAGLASSRPIWTKPCAGSAAWCLIHHSWKWIALRAPSSSTTTCVSQRWSDIGSIRTPGCHRAHSAAVTSESG